MAKMAGLDELRAGLAGAATGGALGVLCTALYAFAPGETSAIFQNMMHGISISARQPVVLSSAVLGVVLAAITGFFIGFVFAWFYNRVKA